MDGRGQARDRRGRHGRRRLPDGSLRDGAGHERRPAHAARLATAVPGASDARAGRRSRSRSPGAWRSRCVSTKRSRCSMRSSATWIPARATPPKTSAGNARRSARWWPGCRTTRRARSRSHRRASTGRRQIVWTTNVVSNVVRFGHWKAGNLQALYATPWIPYSIEEDQRNVFASVYRLCLLGHAEMQQMHFALAERYFTESMQLAERHSGPKSISAALCAPMIAQIWYEQGRLDEAEALLVDLMPVIDLAVLLDSTLIAYRVLIRIAVARSRHRAGLCAARSGAGPRLRTPLGPADRRRPRRARAALSCGRQGD